MKQINPFSNSRVDTPFQHHIDLKEVYQTEFVRLNSVIDEIKSDIKNHQTKGAVVTGEPGIGKTHMMMRLATERLASNRLLFIRQPNNIDSVLYHI
jgi:predicted ATP-dependent serine protease